jgi:hypothetical protein
VDARNRQTTNEGGSSGFYANNNGDGSCVHGPQHHQCSNVTASNEKLKIRMKRSESWDAKNQVYSNSAVITANLAEKKLSTSKVTMTTTGVSQLNEKGITLPINIQERYYPNQRRYSDNGEQVANARSSFVNMTSNRFSNPPIVSIREDEENMA